MCIVYRVFVAGAVALMAAGPAGAQRGAPPKTQAQRADTTNKAPGAVSLDFQDQDLKVVLDAIAAAGDLNVSLTNIPQTKVTIRLGKPVPREELAEMLKSYAESQGLKVTQTPTLMQIVGTQEDRNARQTNQQLLAQQLLQANQQQQVRLYTFRLKHASAVQLAPVLSSLFGGFSGGGTPGRATIIPNGNGGISVITPPNVTFNQGGRGGRGNAGRGNQEQAVSDVFATLNTRFQQATGALSNQANEIRIIAEESSNSLLVRATESDFALVQQIIQGVDLRPLQVLIEVTIAEVQRTQDYDVGVSGSVSRIPKGKTVADVTATAPSAADARDFIMKLAGGNGTIKYDVAIAALQERGDVRVLSLPVIIAQNNRQAVLNVGSSRPFVQVSQSVAADPSGRIQTVQYIDVGTVLTITPTINPDGYVNLQVSQTDNSATNQVQFDAPIINKREATTQVFIRDGQTTVIGGLSDRSRSRDVSGIPFLSRIPLLGPLIFGRTTHNDETSELYLFLTPHIISSDEDIDRYREAVRGSSELLQELNIGPHIIPRADTLQLRPDSLRIRPDTAKKDSLTTLRRRPPATKPDTVPPVWQ